jgi:hypothetical protein
VDLAEARMDDGLLLYGHIYAKTASTRLAVFFQGARRMLRMLCVGPE